MRYRATYRLERCEDSSDGQSVERVIVKPPMDFEEWLMGYDVGFVYDEKTCQYRVFEDFGEIAAMEL